MNSFWETFAGGESGGVLHNMSVPPRSEVRTELRSVHGVTAISLVRCLRINGHLGASKTPRQSSRRLLAGGGPVWKRLEALGCSQQQIDAANHKFSGVLIGWLKGIPKPSPDPQPVCADLALTVAILTRRIGNLYLSHREPDWSLNHLLETEFLCDDPRLIATRRADTTSPQS